MNNLLKVALGIALCLLMVNTWALLKPEPKTLGGVTGLSSLTLSNDLIVNGTSTFRGPVTGFTVNGTGSISALKVTGSSTVPWSLGAGFDTSLLVKANHTAALGDQFELALENASGTGGIGIFTWPANCPITQIVSGSTGYPFITYIPGYVNLASTDCTSNGWTTSFPKGLLLGNAISGERDVNPISDNVSNFGSSTRRWKDAWFNGVVTTTSLVVGATTTFSSLSTGTPAASLCVDSAGRIIKVNSANCF